MTVSDITKNLLQYFNCQDLKVEERNMDGRILVDIQTAGAKDLIGERGSTLSAIQHMIRRIASKQMSPNLVVDIDINGYRKIRENILRDFALDVGGRVRLNKKSVELEPMSSTDRRVVHLALASFPDLATESCGEGLGRYIVVRPYP